MSSPHDTRTALLDAAWDLIARDGAGVSVAQICRAAGVSRQAGYLHFGSRGGLLMALVHRADERFRIRPLLFDAFSLPDPRDRLETSISVWLDFVVKIEPVASDLIRLRATDQDAAAAWEDRMTELRSWLTELVGSVHTDGALAPGWGVEDAASYLWATTSVQIWGLLRHDCSWTEKRTRAALTRGLTDTLLAPPSLREIGRAPSRPDAAR